MGHMRLPVIVALVIALLPCASAGNGCLCTVEYVNSPDMVAPWGQVNIDDLFEVLACWGEDVPLKNNMPMSSISWNVTKSGARASTTSTSTTCLRCCGSGASIPGDRS